MSRDDDVANAPTKVGSLSRGDLPPAWVDSNEPAAPQVIADRYEILGLLGAGGMGRVYRAHDRSLDEKLALKLMRHELLKDETLLERFRQEVKLARRVTSEHVVRTFDFGQHGQDYFLTMELIEGSSLARMLERGPVAMSETLRIVAAVCSGMATAHAVGVTHRDIKPDNVLVGRTGRVAITDFGIARAASDAVSTSERFAGTPAYMAPEQVEGANTIGPPADVYAIGSILFELITRRRPFMGNDPIAVAVARLHNAAPDPRTLAPVPDGLAELVIRCLARDPGARFADAGELRRALEGLASVASVTVVPGAPLATMPRVPDRSALTVAILPLRGAGALAEIADGLTEEIVDVLSMTPALRVRPLTSVRAASQAHADSLAVGRVLGVDVVVDGSLRQRGAAVRLSARAIGVEDGFQLWANHVDAQADGLLSAGDEIAQAVAKALTVQIQVPARAAGSARAIAIYLEQKALLRANWLDTKFEHAIAALEQAHSLAPDDPSIQSTLALALARSAFYGTDTLARARVLAEQVVKARPELGEAWQALAFACHYDGAVPEAASAFHAALGRAPGLAMAQAALGGILLEAGAIEDAVRHLDGARAIDPDSSSAADLARAQLYLGRPAEAEALLGTMHAAQLFSRLWTARFRMWRGERSQVDTAVSRVMPPNVVRFGEIAARVFGTQRLDPADRDELVTAARSESQRLRASRFQFIAEFAMFGDQPDVALAMVEESVGSGLQDHLWMSRCPMLAPLRGQPRFEAVASVVAERARAVLAAMSSGSR